MLGAILIVVLIVLIVYFGMYSAKPNTNERSITASTSMGSLYDTANVASAPLPAVTHSSSVPVPTDSVSAGSGSGPTMPTGAIIKMTTQANVVPAVATTVTASPSVPTIAAPITPAVSLTASTSNIPPPAPSATTLAIMLPNYTFHPGMTFGGNDLSNTGLTDAVPKLSAWCDNNAQCKGFTTDAWMKSAIIDEAKWYKWSDDPKKGLYVKK